MKLTSIGDISRMLASRTANLTIKSRISIASQELTTGKKYDIANHFRGDLSLINRVENRINIITAFNKNIHELNTITSGMQSALSKIRDISSSLGPDLLAAAELTSSDQIDIRLTQSSSLLEDAINTLHTQVANKNIFSGDATDAAPLPSAAEFLDKIRDISSNSSSFSELESAITTWFDDESGAETYIKSAYSGGNGSFSIPISDKSTQKINISAKNPEIKNMLKGLSLLFSASENSASLTLPQKRDIIQKAGVLLTNSVDEIIAQQSLIGSIEHSAAKMLKVNEGELTSLSITRSNLISADQYQAATDLTKAQAELEILYAVTARLSSLKLTDFLR